MTSFIWKPSTVNSWKRKPVFLVPGNTSESPVITDSSGKQYKGQFINFNEDRSQFAFDPSLIGMSDLTVSFGGQTGKIGKGATSFEGNDLAGLQARAKGSLGDTSGGSGVPSGFAPGNFNGQGFFPAYLGDQFPQPFLFNTAPFKFTDPAKFAKEYGEVNRGEMQKNFDLAKRFALDTLDTELQGLQGYVPGASALKRRETALDNVFNQMQREQQVDRALPEVRGQLAGQASRAEAYAEGRVPDSITDRMLELTGRSAAADRATASGFGPRSAAARKVSDLMSAEQRINLSRYGDQLLSSNINQKQQTFLAPTSYSDAGAQVRVQPEVGAGRLTQQGFSEVNRATILDPGQAFSGTINQEQFKSNLEQQTRMTNNATQNNFALTKFQYDVGYAGAVAGAGQTAANTQIALDQQKRAEEVFKDYLEKAQAAGQLKDIISGIASLPGLISGISGAIKGITDLFSSSSGEGSSAGEGAGGTSSGDGGTGSGAGTTVVDVGDTSGAGEGASDVGDASGAGSGATDIAGTDTVQFSSANQVAPGYTPLRANQDGTVDAVPDSSLRAQFTAFSKSLDVPKPSASAAAQASAQSSAALRNAGLSYDQLPGFQSVGVDDTGKEVFASRQLMDTNDTQAGARLSNTTDGILRPLGIFNYENKEGLAKVSAIAGDTAFIASLTDLAQRKDAKGFVSTVLNRFKIPISEAITDDPNKQAGVGASFTAFNLFQNWGTMSGAQKSLGLATLGIQGYKFATGENLATKVIPGTDIAGTPPLNVGTALKLFGAGYNVYSMVNNWGQLNNLQKVAGGTGTVASIAEAAKSLNMLGTGVTGAATAANAAQLASAGYSAAPAFGIGAQVAAQGAAVPTGYTAVASSAQGTVIVPTANLNSAAATSSTAGSVLGTAAGVAGIALGAQAVYKGWGTGGKGGAINGALGGSAMAAGLYTLGYTNPYLMAGVVAVSLIGNLAKTGKHKDQVGRDAVRGAFQKNGLIDKDYKVTLADGTSVDVGIDGHGGERGWANEGMRTDEHKGQSKLRAYEVDYTNDLDYSASMMGNTLSKLLGGGKDKAIGQIGGQLGNAGLGNIGFGKEMTEANFNKLSANMRAMFAKSGIKSKADAYALANQGFGEKRWNDTDTVVMHQAINMAFDKDGYSTASKLMSGRHRGIEVASKNPTGESSPDKVPEGRTWGPKGAQPLIYRFDPKNPPPGVDFSKDRGRPYVNRSEPMRVARSRRDADSMKARNAERYAQRY